MTNDKETIEHFEYDLETEVEKLKKLGLCYLKYNQKIASSNPAVDINKMLEEIRDFKEDVEC